MSDLTPQEKEQRAMRRVGLMNAARFGSIIVAMIGIAMTQGAIEGYPNALAYILCFAGAMGFFFGPYALVRKWKSAERDQENDR